MLIAGQSIHVYSQKLLERYNVMSCALLYIVSTVYLSRLAGFPPFWHRKQLVMLRNIMDGKYEFVSPEWDIISESAKDLVRIMTYSDTHSLYY